MRYCHSIFIKMKIAVFLPLLAGYALSSGGWDILHGRANFEGDEILLDRAVILWKETAPQNFCLDVRVQIIEKRENAEACIVIGANDDASQFLQVYLDQPSNSLRTISIGGEGRAPEVAQIPFKIEMGKWYHIRVLVQGDELLAYLEGKPFIHLKEVKLVGKRVGLRVGDGISGFSGFSLSELSPERKYLIGDGELKIGMPLMEEILEPLDIKLQYNGETSLRISLKDGRGKTYYSTVLRKGTRRLRALAMGALGSHKMEIVDDKGKVIIMPFEVYGETKIETESGFWEELFLNLRETVRRDRFLFTIDGETVAMNPTWLRDHIHEMKGYKWWEKDLRSALNHFLRIQHPEGFFYEMIISPQDPHTTYVEPKHRLIDEKNNLAYVRLEMEADIEYLMVEGVYQAWQATGDDEWLKNALPKLKKGMEYCMSHPKRWDKEHQLVKRTFSIDTWDFTYGIPGDNRRIDEGMPLSIMHGDNSGMYYSSVLLSRMYKTIGEEKEAKRWEDIAHHFKKRTNELCWNGKFYTHQIHLNHQGAPGVDEREILSLSNTYDINRGLPDHQQAVSIIREYKRRRELAKGEYFAEWFSIHPPYSVFKAHEWMKPGTYINGGIAGFVAGELAKAALWHGEEDYGVDVLKRVAEKVREDGEIGFLYTPDGKEQGGGPKGWSASAVISALIEGLAGIKDEDKLLRRALIAPRWISASERTAKVLVRYGPSDAYLGYIFRYKEDKNMIEMTLFSSETIPQFHILLPPGKNVKEVNVNGGKVPFKEEKIEGSSYCDFSLNKPVEQIRVTISFVE